MGGWIFGGAKIIRAETGLGVELLAGLYLWSQADFGAMGFLERMDPGLFNPDGKPERCGGDKPASRVGLNGDRECEEALLFGKRIQFYTLLYWGLFVGLVLGGFGGVESK